MKLFGKKIEMTHVVENFVSMPVTAIDITENYVVSRSETKNVIGWGKKKKTTKAEQGQFKEVGFVPLKSMEVDAVPADAAVGQPIVVVEVPKKVSLFGLSKGKGFAGVVKRYNFRGGPKTHGQSDRLRAPGSIGPGGHPGRVLKGTRMAGRMGSDKVTVKNLDVVRILDIDNKKIMLVKGSVPGAKGTLVNVWW